MAWHISALVQLVGVYGYPFLVAFVLIASAGAPLPVGALLAALGALSVEPGGPDFVLLAAFAIGSSVSGDLFDYSLGRLAGPALLRRVGKLLHLTGNKKLLRLSERWQRWDVLIVVTRFALTSVASPVSIGAGAARFPLPRFLLWDAFGETIFVCFNLAVGRLLGVSLVSDGAGLLLAIGIGGLFACVPLLVQADITVRARMRSSRARQDAAVVLASAPDAPAAQDVNLQQLFS